VKQLVEVIFDTFLLSYINRIVAQTRLEVNRAKAGGGRFQEEVLAEGV